MLIDPNDQTPGTVPDHVGSQQCSNYPFLRICSENRFLASKSAPKNKTGSPSIRLSIKWLILCKKANMAALPLGFSNRRLFAAQNQSVDLINTCVSSARRHMTTPRIIWSRRASPETWVASGEICFDSQREYCNMNIAT